MRVCDPGQAFVKNEKGCQTCICQPISYSCPAIDCPTCPSGARPVRLRSNGQCSTCGGCKLPKPCPEFNLANCRKCRVGQKLVPFLNSKGCTVCGSCMTCSTIKCQACEAGYTEEPVPITKNRECPGCPHCVKSSSATPTAAQSLLSAPVSPFSSNPTEPLLPNPAEPTLPPPDVPFSSPAVQSPPEAIDAAISPPAAIDPAASPPVTDAIPMAPTQE